MNIVLKKYLLRQHNDVYVLITGKDDCRPTIANNKEIS